MDLLTVFGVLAIAALLVASLSTGEITKVLQKNGEDVDPKDFRWFRWRRIAAYLKRYKDVTLETQGVVGRAYYVYPAASFVLGALIVAGILTRVF